MLLCQNFGWRHQRDLISVFHGNDRGFEGNDRLPRSDVSLQQAAHGKWFLHIRSDFFKHAFLRRSRMKRQNLFYCFAGSVIQTECDSSLRFLLAALEFKSHLYEKKLLEDKPNVRGCPRRLQIVETLAWFGPVGFPERISRGNKRDVLADEGRNRIWQVRRQAFQCSVNNAAKPTRGEPSLSGRFVNRHNSANFKRGFQFLLGGVGRIAISGVT